VASEAQRIGGPAGSVPVFGLSVAIAVAIHSVVVFVLLRLDAAEWNRNDDPVQIEVAESPPPQRPELRP
jgi:hypothetical protein